MELKEVINLIKEYLSLCEKIYEESHIECFTCRDELENLPKLSPEVLSCVKRILDSVANSWITFNGETFILDIAGETTIDLLDSSEWHLNDREYLNNFAFDILALRNEWKKDVKRKYVNKKKIASDKKEERIHEKIRNWINKNYIKDTQDKLKDLVWFWAMRGNVINTPEHIELAKMSFEEILENHPEWLE